jgi:hypothetical protein
MPSRKDRRTAWADGTTTNRTTNFYIYVRHFDPAALEEAVGLLGVEVTGDFSS